MRRRCTTSSALAQFAGAVATGALVEVIAGDRAETMSLERYLRVGPRIVGEYNVRLVPVERVGGGEGR